jgi:hypothetical protein
MLAGFHEINVQALISATEFAQSFAVKIFEVYSPPLFAWRIGCEIMLSAGRTLADPNDVLPDVRR